MWGARVYSLSAEAAHLMRPVLGGCVHAMLTRVSQIIIGHACREAWPRDTKLHFEARIRQIRTRRPPSNPRGRI